MIVASTPEMEFLADVLIPKLKGISRPKLELIIGDGDREKGAEEIAKALRYHIKLLPTRLVAKRWRRPKLTIVEWCRHYKIELTSRGRMRRVYKLVASDALHTLEEYGEWTYVNGLPVRELKVYPTSELAYLIGYILGDGSADSRHILIDGSKMTKYGWQLIDRIYPIFKKAVKYLKSTPSIFYKKRIAPTAERMIRTRRSEAKYWYIRISSSGLANMFNFKGYLRESLKVLLNPELSFFSHFLGGLWDADGTLGYKYEKPSVIKLTQKTDKEWWLEMIQRALKNRGIRSSVQGPILRTIVFRRSNKIIGTYEEMIHTLYIWRKSWTEFLNLIEGKHCHPKHLERVKVFKAMAKDSVNVIKSRTA